MVSMVHMVLLNSSLIPQLAEDFNLYVVKYILYISSPRSIPPLFCPPP